MGRTVRAIETRASRLHLHSKSPRAWSDEENDLLLRLAREQLGGQEISRQMGRTPSAVRQQAAKIGVTVGIPRKPRTPWRAGDDALLTVLSAKGITRNAAAAEMARDPGTIRNHARRLDLDWRNPERLNKRTRTNRPKRDVPALVAQLRALERNGWSVGMAALELDINGGTAGRLSKTYGINWHVRGRSVRGDPLD
jgi:hypothetical protein